MMCKETIIHLFSQRVLFIRGAKKAKFGAFLAKVSCLVLPTLRSLIVIEIVRESMDSDLEGINCSYPLTW